MDLPWLDAWLTIEPYSYSRGWEEACERTQEDIEDCEGAIAREEREARILWQAARVLAGDLRREVRQEARLRISHRSDLRRELMALRRSLPW